MDGTAVNLRRKIRLAHRIAILFTVAMLVLVIVIGATFTVFFRDRSKNEMRESSFDAASVISNLMSKTLSLSPPSYNPPYQKPEGSTDFGRLPNQPNDFWINEKTLISFINNLTATDVWIVDNQINILSYSEDSSKTPVSKESLNTKELNNIKNIMELPGYCIYTESFSHSLGSSYLSVGVPIYSEYDKTIVGAVLVHTSLKSVDRVTTNGLLVLCTSCVVALAVSLVVAWVIAKIISKPLYKIRNAAVMISEGDYGISTGVSRSDEIGELAETIDEMGRKLEVAEQQSQKLEGMRRDFISNISHELRTPVTVMRSSLEALCDGVVTDPEQIDEYHRQMLNESVYLQRMVNDLLDLSRLQNADFQMNIDDFNLCDCLNDAVRSVKRIAMQKNITIELECDTNVFTVTGDYDRIKQLFIIVLDNAVKFTAPIDTDSSSNQEPVLKPVQVRFSKGVVSVKNTGSEIKKEDLPYIFDRFFKSHSEENKEGTGLGLAIAKQIALRHGIGVMVLSKKKVTTFLFDFKT